MPTIEVSIVMFLIHSILCYLNYEKKNYKLSLFTAFCAGIFFATFL